MEYREREIERIVSETVNLLVSDVWRNADGGWGVAVGRPSDAWSTAEISELLTTVSRSLGVNITEAHLPTILEDANTFLAEHQNGDGGWGVEAGKSDATGTELVMIALEQSGQRKFHPHLQRAVDWMMENQNSVDAGWALRGKEVVSSIYCTCFGCIALNNLPEILKTPIVEQRLLGVAETFLLKARNPNGGWGDIQNAPSKARSTAYGVFTLLTVFSLHHMVEPSISWLKQHQNEDGGWGEAKEGSIEATTATIIALLAFETNPNSKCILRGIDYLLACRDPAKGTWPEKRNETKTFGQLTML